MTEYAPAKTGEYPGEIPQSSKLGVLQKKNISTIAITKAFIWLENMPGYFSSDIICSSKLTVFLELASWKTICLLEQRMSADKSCSDSIRA